MSKKLKKILIISDDYQNDFFKQSTLKKINSGKYFASNDFHNGLGNKYKFKTELVESFKNIKITKYDAIIVDYGLIGGDEEDIAIELLRNCNAKNILLIISSASSLGYWRDVQVSFPKLKLIHDLPVCDIGADDILYSLYSNLK